MQHYYSLDNLQLDKVWLTIGSFDGVHLGHQKIISKLTAEAHKDGSSAVVLTFFPHPATIIRGRDFPFYLTNPDEKANIIGELGVDYVVTLKFDHKLAATPARSFMETLYKHLGLQELWIGYDFALGRNREGNAKKLGEIGQDLGYRVETIEPFKMDNQIVSSSRIRFLLGAGQVENAAIMLDRNYVIDGVVIKGDQRGQSIGFPTANLDIWEMRAIPAAGVYICQAEIRSSKFNAVTNIGVRPTFEESPVPPRVEAHLLDFDGDIYGESIKINFIKRLRGEKRFESVDHLTVQIRKDIENARKFLS
jgi:riboflavin kinase/FMN adenylyltransferase